jgi:hypothetical protein
MKPKSNILVHLRIPAGSPTIGIEMGGGKRKQTPVGDRATRHARVVPGTPAGKRTSVRKVYAVRATASVTRALSGGTRKGNSAKAKTKSGKSIASAQSRKRVQPASTGHRRVMIGIWDLGSWIGRLPDLLDLMNKAQQDYLFRTVQATVPVGLIRTSEGAIAWAKQASKRPLRKDELDSISSNAVDSDFYSIAEPVRKELGLDFLVGITPSKVAWKGGGRIHWDYFSSYEGKLVIVSTYDLRRFSAETDTPFESFVAGIIVAQVLVAQFERRNLGFHDNRGCLFDFNEDRESLKDKAGSVVIEEECLRCVGPRFRNSAIALTDLIRSNGATR